MSKFAKLTHVLFQIEPKGEGKYDLKMKNKRIVYRYMNVYNFDFFPRSGSTIKKY